MPSPDRTSRSGPFDVDGFSLEILYEDNHLLVVDKPAGLLVQPDATGDASLFDLVAAMRKARENKAGNAFVGIVHRLDRPVGGILVVAKTSKAAARLSKQFRDGTVRKTYWAIVETPATSGRDFGSIVSTESVVWRDGLVKDAGKNVSSVGPNVNDQHDGNSRWAETAVRLLQWRPTLALLELTPFSGRSHQLRVQCAARGLPIVGDRKYGSTAVFGRAIALHAVALQFAHPVGQAQACFTTPPPSTWSTFQFDWKAASAATSQP